MRRAAGYLEGVLTAVRVKQHFDNLYSWLLGQFQGATTLPQVYLDWMTQQDAFMRQQIATNTSDWWVQMSFVVAQFDGLVAGYGAASNSTNALSAMDLAILNVSLHATHSTAARGRYCSLLLRRLSATSWTWCLRTFTHVLCLCVHETILKI